MIIPELVDIHLDEEIKKKIRTDKVMNRVFNNATLGQNVNSLESYQQIATFIINYKKDLKKMLWNELPEVYDLSGYLV